MSDRDLLLPERAFGQMLASLLTGSRRAAREMTWPGAARLAIVDYGINPPLNITGGAVLNILSIDLDPGRWLVTGGLYSLDASTAGGSFYTINSWLNVPGDPPFKTSVTQYTIDVSLGNTQTTSVVSRSVKVPDGGQNISLTVQAIETISQVQLQMYYLLAVPA